MKGLSKLLHGKSDTTHDLRDKLIVALDVSSKEDAQRIVDSLGDAVNFYKIGSQFAYSGGIDFIKYLADNEKKVFLDVKLLDVYNTVEKAVESIIAVGGVSWLTIHSYRHAIKAAIEATKTVSTGPKRPKILCVTVLTNMDKDDLIDMGYPDNVKVESVVLRRARAAHELGADGVIASGLEARAIRDSLGPDFTIVTPGIRLAGAPVDDQKRTATPYEAIESGADYIVVGRPIVRADDPRGEAQKILDQIRAASEAASRPAAKHDLNPFQAARAPAHC